MIKELLSELKEKGIVISYSNGKLHYKGPEQNIDSDLLEKLLRNKYKLLKYFWPKDCPNMMPIHTEGNKIPFVFIHGGEINYSLSTYLGKDQPFYGFFYLGSEGESIKYNSVGTFSDAYINQIKNILPHGPYILGGVSFGGVLAYEIAIRLLNEGENVPALVLIDSVIPAFDKKNVELKRFPEVRRFSKEIYYWVYNNIRNYIYRIFHLVGLKLPVSWRNSYIIWTYSKLAKKYMPHEKFDGSILLFKVEGNKLNNKYLGWNQLCNNIELEIIPGTHGTMYSDRNSHKILQEKTYKFFKGLNLL